MKINIVSDLHLEFGDDVCLPGGDVLIVAGDAHVWHEALPYIEKWEEMYNKVIYFPGNHEYYNRGMEDVLINDRGVCVIDDVAIIYATLWTDFGYDSKAMDYAYNRMNDYRMITIDGRTLLPQDTVDIYEDHLDYIIDNLEELKDKTFVVATHHSPTMNAPEQYRGDLLNHAYGSDLTAIIKKYNPALWVHGHTHTSMDYMVGDTRVVCNPRGYQGYDLNPAFNPDLTIEV